MSDANAGILHALTDLREQGNRIPIYDSPRLFAWFEGLADLISELPHGDQRLAWVILIGNDLCQRIPGVPLSMAAAPLLMKLQDLEKSRV